MDSKRLNVLLSSDNNYAQHLGVTIYSLLEHNINFETIYVYIIDNDISDDSKDKLECISNHFKNSKIIWIPFTEWKAKLKLNMTWNISISTYARLFLSEMLPKSIDRVLYMDCDMIVCDSLRSLWNTDLQGKVLGAVQDDISDDTKAAVGLLPKDKYFNSGLLLVDLVAWKEQDVGEKCQEFIIRYGGRIVHHDQGVLNGILKDKWYRLPIKYNLMTIHYVFNLKQIERYFSDHSDFYTKKEIDAAKETPVILHYTPSFTSRPWVKGCVHPERKRYWDVLSKTAWKEAKPVKDNSKWYVKIINWRYRVFKC